MKLSPTKTILPALLCTALLMAGCDVHEFPKIPETVPVVLHLRYDMDMTIWNHVYDGTTVSEVGLGETYDNSLEEGVIRYVIRTYPMTKTKSTLQDFTQELVLTKDLSESSHDLTEDYDYDVTIDLVPGDYDIMVWSDLVPDDGAERFYDKDDFAKITFQAEYTGDTDYRDAFRGSNSISIAADILEHEQYILEIPMERPLAKYEFIATDLEKFLDNEQTRVSSMAAEIPDGEAVASVDVGNYRVVFYYVGFMPDTYNMFTDKPVDASTGDLFDARLSVLSQSEASMGFDYVFVNGTESAVTVQVAIYDSEDSMISLTDPITVPLKRSRHTILRGEFLTGKASGGVYVDPNYEGDHNIIIP